MSMQGRAQFTPGPWFANQSEMEAHSCKVEIRTTNGAYLICSDAGYQNAPLIAAAPAMYGALVAAYNYLAEMGCDCEEGRACGDCVVCQVREAKAQAEGRQV